VPPKLVAIEKKSTGGTLLSLIDEIRTVRLLDIPRNKATGGKTKRFIDSQAYIAEKRISLPSFKRHSKVCIEHMSKITANETHRWDDIADTCADAIKIALIDKTLSYNINRQDDIATKILSSDRARLRLRENIYGSGQRIIHR
jgi:hypothetical protein